MNHFIWIEKFLHIFTHVWFEYYCGHVRSRSCVVCEKSQTFIPAIGWIDDE